MGLLDKFYGRGRDIFKVAIMATGLSAANPGMAQPVEAYPPSAEQTRSDTQQRVHSLCNTAPDATLSESLACNQSPTALLGLGRMSLGDTQVGVGTSKKYGPGVNGSGVFLNDIGNSGVGIAMRGNKYHINATLVAGHTLKYGNMVAGISGAHFDVEKGLGFKNPIDSRGTAYRAFIGVSDMRASETLSFNAYAFRERASNIRLAVEEKIVPIKWSDTSPDATYSYSGNERQVARTNFFGNTSTGVFGDAIWRMGEGSIITRLGYMHQKNDFTGEKVHITYGVGYNHTTDQNRWNVMFNQNGNQKNITAEVGAKISKNLAWFAQGYVSQSPITMDYGVMMGIDTATWRRGLEQGMMNLKGRISATMSDTGTGTISDAASMGTIGTVHDNPTRLSSTLQKVDITVPNPVENLSVIQLPNGKYQIQFSASSNTTKPLYYMSINGKAERAITNGTLIDAEELNPEGENRIDVVVVNAPGSALAAPASVSSATRTPYIARSEKRTCIIIVNPTNKPPVANPDSVTTAFDTSVLINVLGNDTDPENNTLSIGTFTQPQNGTVTRSGARLIYTPKPGFSGTDTFVYYSFDGKSNSITPATVSVTVTPEIKQPPAPTDTTETIISGGNSIITPTSITVPPPTITDIDNPTGFNPAPTLVVKDASGNVVSSNSLTPDTPYTYYFTYMTYNGATNKVDTKPTTPVSFRTLALPNQPPVAFGTIAPISLTAGVAGSTVLPSTPDKDGDTLKYFVSALPDGFSFDPSTRTLSWTASVIPGSYSNIIYTADDGKGGIVTTALSLVVASPVLSTPTAINLSGTTTLTQGSLTVGQQIANLTCTQAEGKSCTYATTSSDVVIAGNTMQIKNASLPAGTYMIPVTATVTNAYGVTKVFAQNVSVTVEAPVLPTLPASLPDLTVGDNGGITVISFDIQMPLDVPYQVSGLPTSDGWGQSVSWSVTQTGSTIHVRALSSFVQGGNMPGIDKSTFPLSITSSGAQGTTYMDFLVEAI